MSSRILLGLCAPRLCPLPPPAPHEAKETKSVRRKPRRLWRLWLPQRTSTLPFHKDSSKRSASGSCPCSWVPCRKPPLSLGSSRPQAIHRDVRPALIYEYQPPDVEARSQPSPQSPRSLVAFLGYLRLFLSGHPPGSRAMLRLIVASETFTPVSSKKASQCSLRVRSGLELS